MKEFVINIFYIIVGLIILSINIFCIIFVIEFIQSNILYQSTALIFVGAISLVMIGIGSIKSDEAHIENVRRNLEDN
jgi:membrane protein required for beta-lactamase induction